MEIDGCALVFGGARGIGRACALAFARFGARRVLVADLDYAAACVVAENCQTIASNPDFQAEGALVDVCSEESVSQITARAAQTFGRIDYCVNSAGLGVQNPREIAEANVAEFNQLLQTNVTGTFLVTKCASATMKSQDPRPNYPSAPERGLTRGSIVNLGSASSFASTPSMVQYTTSKFAVLGLTKNSALDNAAHGIRVNCVCPSWVDTPMIKQAIADIPSLKDQINSAVPLGRIASADEVADAVIFLCSPRSSYITGSGLIIDGGTTLTSHA
ncbi:hypothetical protein JX265_004625 [Neoarthrinium moseri]|uniref:NAD(P)-binding protein n=1 Tax=Neoarthrinium moseri TaxID=1658444 RepID=A0A9Q0AN80_9PEZI|nr:hypothetical protein JX266_000407 [Neoarthrinium moseri]KAI1874417.1 hypothetical protein JX265_004625 [Neoarthrinium moseri]